MKYYAVAEIDVCNPDWIPEYVESVTKLVEVMGGRYLARTSEAELIEGDGGVKNISLIIEFPSKQIAYSFYESQDYAPFLKSRMAGSKGRFILIAGKDDANRALNI